MAMDAPSNSASTGNRKKRWATKTKTGCDTCRIRRIKCDERKPQCQRCELGRRTCIGVFYGKPSGNISDSSASSPPSITSASRSASPPPRVAAMIVRRHGVPKSPNNPPQFVGTLDVRDLIHLAPSLATATHTVEPSADWYEFIRARVRELTSYIFYLPSRSGHDNALDSAIRCTASGFREFAQSGSDSLSLFRTGEKSVALYTSALRELQTALQDPKRSTSAEVLCATELLCIFEALSSPDADGTVQHAKGAYHLIQNRGVSRFNSEFDKSLFLNQLPLLAVQSFHQDQICFLGQSHWQELIKASVPTTTGMDAVDDYILSFYLNSINITNTFIKITALALGSVPKAEIESFRQAIMLELEEETMDSQRWRLQLLRGRPPYPPDDSDDDSFSKWQDVYDAYQCSMLLFNRMYVAVGAEQAELFEQQAQMVALNLLNIARARPQSSIRRPNTIFVEPTCLAVIKSAEPWAEYAAKCTANIAAGKPTSIVPAEQYKLWTSLLGIQLSAHPTPNNGTGY